MIRHCALVLLLTGWLTPAAALTIRGDAAWREDPSCSDGWQELATDDGAWRTVRYPWLHIRPPAWDVDPHARPFWGTAPRSLTCVRRTFELERAPTQATAHVWVDDDYELYVNGALIGASSDQQATLPGESYTIAATLRPGRNVIGLRLVDGGGAMAALFSLTIPQAPETKLSGDGDTLTPWTTAGLFLLALLVWSLGMRNIAHRLGRLRCHQPAERNALGALALAGIVQAFLAMTTLYTGEREIPALQWNAAGLGVLAILLTGLVLLAYRLPDARTDTPSLRQELLLLGAVVGLAVGLRLLWIDSIPVGFFQDEATNANDAHTLGGQPDWYVWSDSVGGRPTLFLYLLHWVFATFGASYGSLKILPVAIGTLSVVAIYAFARLGFGARVALWAAFLLAVSRWHLHYSRMAWEAILLPLCSAGGFALLLYALQGRRGARAALVAAGAVLASGLYGYAAYRAVPAVVVVFLLWTLVSAQRRAILGLGPAWLLSGGLALGVLFPLLRFAWLQPELYWTRYSEVSLTEYMHYYGTPWPWLEQIGRSLLSLHHVGDGIIRHNLAYRPHLDAVTGMLLLVGMAVCVWRTHELAVRLVCVWFCAYLALASLTCDGPHATRLLGLVPVVAVIAAIGIEQLRTAWWRLGSDRQRRLLGVGLVTLITGLNAYEYFVLEARHPDASVELNTTGRTLCEYVRRQQDLEVYWSEDIAFWADGQCLFLARGRYKLPRPLRIDDLRSDSPLSEGEAERLIVIGPEMVQTHSEILQPQGDHLRTALPIVAEAVRDADGRVLYWQAHLRPRQRAFRRGAGP